MPKLKDTAPFIQRCRRSVRTSIRLIKIIWKHEKALFTASAVVTILPSVLPFLNAYIYKLIIDQLVTFASTHTLNQNTLYFLFTARLISYFLSDVAYRTQDLITHLLWTKMPMVFQQLMLTKISGLDLQYFEDSEFKNLLEKVKDSATHQPQSLVNNVMYATASILQVGLASIALYQLNPLLILCIACVVIPEFIIQTKQSQLAWGIWNWESPLKKRFWYLNDLLQNAASIKETKLYRLAPTFIKDIRSIQGTFFENEKDIANKGYISNIVFRGIAAIVYMGVEIYGITQVLAGKITIGDIGFYTSVVNNFQNGLGGFFRNINGIFESSLYIESMFEVLDTKPIIIDPDNPIQIDTEKAPKIEFRNVDFTYPGTKKRILTNFSLTIEPGEKIAFVGENGAGKSTIIKLLARLYDVSKGEILVNNINIKDIKIADWHACIGVLFQDFNRYDYTLKENIWYGNVAKQPDQAAIKKATHQAAAENLLKDFKSGYDQMLGRTFDEGVEPSGGQWQRIALARAFFRNAPVLVLDEPTASIDAKAEAEIFERVENLSHDKTTIIISHRFSTVRKADTIYVVENGHIIETGNHEKLMKLKGQYASLFSLQAKGYE